MYVCRYMYIYVDYICVYLCIQLDLHPVVSIKSSTHICLHIKKERKEREEDVGGREERMEKKEGRYRGKFMPYPYVAILFPELDISF